MIQIGGEVLELTFIVFFDEIFTTMPAHIDFRGRS